tara:strand:+ start:5828 stop:6874 length:1047 start_codon:yes stop_codon:yes gene_type:complete
MVEFLNRYVSIQKESTYGTEPTAGTGNGEVFGEVDDESLATTYDLMTRQDMSRPIVGKSVTGTERSEGDINLAMQVDDFVGNLLYAFFPQDAQSTPSGSIQKHILTEPSLTSASAGVYPSFTVRVGREEKEHTFTGMVANSLSVSASVGEYVMLSVGFLGKSESAPAALATPTFDGAALDALYFANGTVKFDDGSGSAPAASASVKSISFDINLNRDTDNAYAIGSPTYGRAPPAQRREISGTIEFNKVLYGDQSLDEPDYDALVASDGVQYNDGSDAVMTLDFLDEAGADFIKFEFFNIRFEAPEASVSGRDTNTMTVNFVGLYDDNLGAMRVTAQGTTLSGTQYDA